MTQPQRRLDNLFFALSDATRRAILARLSSGDTTIGELSQPFQISAPAISKHMKILEKAGLINRRVNGRQHHCSLSPGALKTAEDWLNYHRTFWEVRVDAREDFLLEPQTREKKNDKR
jgi:DNA-binding transcriptional ArsR family regulator